MQQEMFNQSIKDLGSVLDTEVAYWDEAYKPPQDGMGIDIANSIKTFNEFRKSYINFISKNQAHLDFASSEWVVNKMYSVLFSHWDPIQRSAEQYTHYKDLLETGYKYIQVYREQGKISGVPTILYFEKVGKAKRFPFQTIYVIGVPMFDAYQGDWSAIPHELGHHIYWNSKFKMNGEDKIPLFGDKNIFSPIIHDAVEKAFAKVTQPRLKNNKELLEDKLKAWEEEIFAEVIGTQIGCITTEKRQDLEAYKADGIWKKIKKQVRTSELFNDDGNHPMPLFLPYIRRYSEAVFYDYRLDKVDDTVGKEWESNLNINLNDLWPKSLGNRTRGVVKFSEIRFALKDIVEGMYNSQNERSDLSVSAFEDILSMGLDSTKMDNKSLISKKLERALDNNYSFERNEFTCALCGKNNAGTAGSSPCTTCGMLGSLITAGYYFIVGR